MSKNISVFKVKKGYILWPGLEWVKIDKNLRMRSLFEYETKEVLSIF